MTMKEGCTIQFTALAVYLAISSWCFDYALASIIDRDIPWYADVLGGTFSFGLSIVAAVVCCILRLCGIEVPFLELS